MDVDDDHSHAPCVVLMGMRGAGKTTLGRLAAEHLHAPFLDADEIFSQRHAGATPKAFVAQYGWPAFRSAETEILRELLTRMQDEQRTAPIVVSLGGGIVEEEVNRALLKRSWMYDRDGDSATLDRRKGIAVIHVFREVDKVLLDQRGMPSWTGVLSGDEVWQRRRPWFRASSSHEFVNFTDGDVLQQSEAETSRAARLRFEAVERDFVRFLHRLLASYRSEAKPWLPSRDDRSYLVTLPFADLRPHVEKLPLLTLGADAIELRADLLHDPSKDIIDGEQALKNDTIEAYENPSLSYLSEQVALVRRHLPGHPLVFTLRTPAQGGRYPYPVDAPADALFTSLRHALKLGCDVIDIEMGLEAQQTRMLVRDAKARRITVLISWRDKVPSTLGGFQWHSTQAAQKLYDEAVTMGADVVKIVGTAGQVSDNFALRVFAAALEERHSAEDEPPLSAYNMAYPGRISRFLNPILASITHPIAKELSKRGVVGNPSMTFAEIQQALHLSGLIEKACFVAVGAKADSVSMAAYRRWFDIMALPYTIRADTWPKGGITQMMRDNDPRNGSVRGLSFSEGYHSFEDVRQHCAGVNVVADKHVMASGCADCGVLHTADKAGPDTSLQLSLSNKIVEALVDIIKNNISPSVHLTRQSICVVLVPDGASDTAAATAAASSVCASAVQATKGVGLERVTLRRPDEAWSGREGDPTIIVNCCADIAAHPTLFDSEEGGLYVELYDNPLTLALVTEQRYKQVGWRSTEAAAVWRHVFALRFRAFTGRRAPSVLADAEAKTVSSSLAT